MTASHCRTIDHSATAPHKQVTTLPKSFGSRYVFLSLNLTNFIIWFLIVVVLVAFIVVIAVVIFRRRLDNDVTRRRQRNALAGRSRGSQRQGFEVAAAAHVRLRDDRFAGQRGRINDLSGLVGFRGDQLLRDLSEGISLKMMKELTRSATQANYQQCSRFYKGVMQYSIT